MADKIKKNIRNPIRGRVFPIALAGILMSLPMAVLTHSSHLTMVLDSPLPQFGPIWRKKSLSGRHFFLVRATMNIKPVLKSSWTKLKHRRCTKRPGELKHINILVLKKSILKKTKKNMETKKLQTLYTSHSLVLPIGHLKQFSLSL